jgi:hypothetical protein
MQCKCGFVHNWKHSLQVASGGLWIEVTWRCKGITTKNYSIFVHAYLLQNKENNKWPFLMSTHRFYNHHASSKFKL